MPGIFARTFWLGKTSCRDCRIEGRAKVDRFEIAAPCCRAQPGKILPRAREELFGRRARNPALQCQAGELIGRADDVVIFTARTFDDVPAIARRLGFVDDQRGDRPRRAASSNL
jgi:hypothetical protein